MNTRKGKVTIKDIADACGVSIKTVSRVVNDSESVSKKTRDIVNATIKELGYQTSILAKGLKGAKTNVIMVFTDRHEEEHLSSWHVVMLKYLFSYARMKNLKVIMTPSNSNSFISEETDGYYLLENGLADGEILLEHVYDDLRVKFLKERGIPFVIFGQVEDDDVCSVSLDNYYVGYKGGSYLIGRGYKYIEFLVGEERFDSNKLRVKGFQDATGKSDGIFNIRYGANTVDKAYRIAKGVLEEEKPDAFFVSGDERAIGVYRAIQEAGYSIPKDIAVLGVDNIPMGNYLHPRISTVDQDFESMARECVELLTKLIDGEDLGNRKTSVFLPSVIEREST